MTAEWDDLARLAQAATPGPWHVHEMGKVFVGNGGPGSLWQVVHMSADDLADLTEEAAQEARRDAAWIAAANPATILRLIADNRRLTHLLGSHADGHRCTCTMTDPGSPFTGPPEWEQDPWCPTHPDVDQIRAEFDVLAARLAAVEADHDALIDRLTAAKALHTPQPGQGTAYCQDCDQRWPCPTRAVLSAAPTDTTKEN